MCGIVGVLSANQSVCSEQEQYVSGMMDSISHRGPDARGLWCDGPIVMGHLRLSIIDTSAASDQPLKDIDTGNVIVFNGEIYNYLEIKSELQAQGVHFRTTGDTEVILKAYQTWGSKCLDKLCGMFAFAIWDQSCRQLFLARDRLGKKPLFYARINGDRGACFLFASEPSAIFVHPFYRRSVNISSFRKTLMLGYSTGEETLWLGVKRLPAGHAIVLNSDLSIKTWQYHDFLPAFENKHQENTNILKERLGDLLDLAVQQRLRADVPFGVFLSGGVDSNTVLATTLKFLATEKTNTFSIGFKEGSFDESFVAESVAAQFGTNHKTFRMTAQAEDIEKIITKAASEPIADGSFLPTYYLANMASKHVKMVLSGDGGDELFAGYPTYVADKIHNSIHRALTPAMWNTVASIIDKILPVSHGNMSLDFKIRQFSKGLSLPPSMAHFSWRVLKTADQWKALLHPDIVSECSLDEAYADFDVHYKKVKHLHPLDQALYVDTKTWLVDSVLVKVDRASMANGLEVRSPLLDHRIAEFAAGLPPNMKLNGLQKKWLLREVARERVPNIVMNQPKKGFSTPIAAWIGKKGMEFVEDMLLSSNNSAYLNVPAVRNLYQEHLSGRSDQGLTLFNLVVMSKWIQMHHQL